MSLKGDFWCSVTLNATLAALGQRQPNCQFFSFPKSKKDDSFLSGSGSVLKASKTFFIPDFWI